MTRWRVLCDGLRYPTADEQTVRLAQRRLAKRGSLDEEWLGRLRYREAKRGDVVNDLPEAAAKWLLEGGLIEEVRDSGEVHRR